jgi:WD40 repeat protein/Ca2+-binding EF-hand superfamily protein
MVLQGHCNPITCLVATEDRSVVATADAGPDSMIVLWNVATGQPVHTISSPHANGVAAMDLTPDGTAIVTVSAAAPAAAAEQEVHVWDLGAEGDEPVLAGVVPEGDVQTCVRFHPNSTGELVTNGKQRVFFWSSQMPLSRELRYYSPPVSARDFKQTVGDFTVSAFTPSAPGSKGGTVRCVTGTADGDIVVWDSGGVAPGGAAAAAAAGMRANDRRAIKILRIHHAAVTFLSTVAGARGTGPTHLVSGGAEGNVRFFDAKFRLVAWFDGLAGGGITSVSFTPAATHNGALDSFGDDEGGGDAPPTGGFDAPNFVVGTDASNVFAVRAATFEESGSAEAIRTAELVLEGTPDAVTAMATHPSQPVLACLGAGGLAWTWNYTTRAVDVKRDLCHRGQGPKPSALCYRSDGRGILVGTVGGGLKALDAETLVEVQVMRFTPHRVMRVVVSDDVKCSHAAVADSGGCVSLFRLHGPIVEAAEGEEAHRAFEFLGKHRAHSQSAPVCGLAFQAGPEGTLELVSCGEEGRLCRFDVFGSSVEGGVKLLDVSDVALGGAAAGGGAVPTSLTFLPRIVDNHSRVQQGRATVLVADDAFKLRTIDVATLTCVRTVLGPTFGGPLSVMVPVNGGAHLAYATPDKVVGLAALPLDGDPARAMGLIAHPGEVASTTAAFDGSTIFTVGGGAAGDAGNVVNVWAVNAAVLDANASAAAGEYGSSDARLAALIEGGAEGEFYREARDYFLYSQLRAQGEDSTAARTAHADGRVPLEELPLLMRALGHYPSERELEDMFRELAVEAAGVTMVAPTSVGFDRFIALFVNHRPVFGVGKDQIEEAFEALGAELGDAVPRDALLQALTGSGEPMSAEELNAAAAALLGPGATIHDLIPVEVTAKGFAEDVLGFLPVEA